MKLRMKVFLALAFCLCIVLAASFEAYGADRVDALYPANGADWNDYVVNDGADIYSASDTACSGTESGGYSACLHGGELRMVKVKGKTSCTGLTAMDALGAFDWACDGNVTPVRMVSTGLKDGTNLSDLLDFTTPGWKPNAVTVYDGGIECLTTSVDVWWTNPVVVDNDGGNLDASGTIYVVTNDALTPATGGYVISASSVGLVGQPGLIIDGPANGPGSYVISADASSNARDFLWVEGEVDATGDTRGVSWNGVRFSVLRNVKADNASTGAYYNATGVYLNNSSNNKLTVVTATYNTKYGVFLGNSSYNTLTDVTASNNTNTGIYLSYSPNNTLTGVTASNNGGEGGSSGWGIYLYYSSNNTLTGVIAENYASRHGYGVHLDHSSNSTLTGVTVSNFGTGIYLLYTGNNTLTGVSASNNIYDGVFLKEVWNSKFSGVTTWNNGIYGIRLEGANYGTFSEVTASNNGYYGIQLYGTNNYNTFSGVTVSNNGYRGLELRSNGWNTFSGVTASNNAQYGVYLYGTSYNYFTGPLKVGYNTLSDCYVYGNNAGLVNETCANQGASDATLTTGVTVESAFVGKVTEDDTVNTSDVNGAAPYASITDWSSFENAFRGWGVDGPAFPDAGNRGICTAGTCRIWDWSAAIGDTVIKDSLSFPTGNDILVHTWNDASSTTLLRNAVEIQGDELGNDNTLCESGETCLYTPNMGSYQGHGNLVSAGSFTDGTITGVTLLMYDTNGR